MRCAVNRRLLKTLLTSLAPFTWPIRGIRQPGANFNFGALIFPKNIGEREGRGGVNNFFPDIKKIVKKFLISGQTAVKLGLIPVKTW
jgi:hypothetical protein